MKPVTISPAPEFPERYQAICREFLVQYYEACRWEMQEGFGIYDLPIMHPDQLMRTYIAETLSTIARAAAGELDRANDDLAGEVREHVQTLMERLFSPPGLGAFYEIPHDFWEQPLGEMVGRALVWLDRDELITIAEAAKLAGVRPSTISGKLDRGTLRSYVDPDANERQGRRLVRRSDVLRVKTQA